MSLPTRSHFLAHNITPSPSSSSSSSSTSCAICKEDYNTTTGHPAVSFSNTTSCNHIFCEPCIVAWLSAKGTNTCPLCRRELFVLDDGEGGVEYEGGVEFGWTFGEEDGEEHGDEDEDEDEEESDWDDEEDIFGFEDEEGGIHDIPLSYLYRNTLLPLLTSPSDTTALLQTIWHKIWNLLSTYRTAVTQAVEQAKRDGRPLPNWDHSTYNRHLPTSTTMLASLVETIIAIMGVDLSGRLSADKMGSLEAVLNVYLEEQVELVNEADGWGDESITPEPDGWKARWCEERVCRLLGLVYRREIVE